MANNARNTAVGLNLSGKIFFGGLCAGTFVLGCWQTKRYFEKVNLIDQRLRDLSEDPVPLTSIQSGSSHGTTGFRRILVEGRFRHENEMYLGPRGPLPGALAMSGPASGRSEGGMSSGPQVCIDWRFAKCTQCVDEIAGVFVCEL